MTKTTTMNVTNTVKFTKESWKMITFSFLIFVPAITFIVVFYLNPNIQIYQEQYNFLKNFFGPILVPSTFLMQIMMWIAFGVLILSLVLVAFSPMIYKIWREKIFVKNVTVGFVIIGLLVSIIVFGIAQFYYAKFFDVFLFVLQIETDNEKMHQIKALFSENYANNRIFGWSKNVGTWWVCFFQIIGSTTIAFLYLVKINPHLNDVSQDELLKKNLIKRRIGQSKFQGLIERISVNNERSLSIWLMILSIGIFMPQLIFIVSSIANNSTIGSIYDWTFKAPKFFAFQNPEFATLMKETKTTEVVIIYLPIIMAGFLISSILIFLLIYLRALSIKKNLFIFQFGLVFFELIITIIINTIAINKLNNIIDVWNADNHKLLQIITTFTNTSIFNNTIYNYTTTGISDLFITGNQYIALCIISVGATICIYAVFFKKMLKFTKYSKTLIE